MSQSPDAIVVGAGIVGAACAYALARDGLSVEVYDAVFAGSGATAEGMGHCVVMDDSDPQFALTSYSNRLLESVVPHLGPDCEYDACGTLWLARTDDELAAVEEKHTYYERRGVATEVLDFGAVAALEPALLPMAGALRVPGDTVVYPPALARWLLRSSAQPDDAPVAAVRPHMLRVIEGAEVLAVDGRGVRTVHGRRDAGLVVNAAGIDAPRLTPRLPVQPRRGHLVITDRAPGFCSHQLVELGYLDSAHAKSGASVAFNLQPRHTGQMLLGSSREMVGRDRTINRVIVKRMIERALLFTPGFAALKAIRVWVGFRPATPDNLPLIGPWPDEPGLWIATGHEGLGITTALGTGQLIADLVADRRPAIDPAPYAPARVSTPFAA